MGHFGIFPGVTGIQLVIVVSVRHSWHMAELPILGREDSLTPDGDTSSIEWNRTQAHKITNSHHPVFHCNIHTIPFHIYITSSSPYPTIIRTVLYKFVLYRYSYTNSYNLRLFYELVPINLYTSMNYQNLSEEIAHLVDKTNKWSSTILIPQGDLRIDVSSAAMGDLSTTPVGATNLRQQKRRYPAFSLLGACSYEGGCRHGIVLPRERTERPQGG
jgi:hypothetical protein